MEDYVGYAVNLQTANGVSYKGIVYNIDAEVGAVTLVDVVEFTDGVPPTSHKTMTFNGDNVTELTIDESIPVVSPAVLQAKMNGASAPVATAAPVAATPYVDPAIVSSTFVDPAIVSAVAAPVQQQQQNYPSMGFAQQQQGFYGGFPDQPRGGRGFNSHTQQYAGQRGGNNGPRGNKRDANSRNMDTFGEMGGVQQQQRGGNNYNSRNNNGGFNQQQQNRGPRQGFQQQQQGGFNQQQNRNNNQNRQQRAPRSNEPVGLLGADSAAPLKEQFKEDLDLAAQAQQLEQERKEKQAEMAAQVAAGYSTSSFFDNLSSDKNKIYGNPQDNRRKEVNMETFGAERVPRGQAGFGGRRRFHGGNRQN